MVSNVGQENQFETDTPGDLIEIMFVFDIQKGYKVIFL